MTYLTLLSKFVSESEIMGISERKEREKEELKIKILAAARELFLEKGYNETSIRNIADKIEYSPTTIYLYYKDKDSIFFDLHHEGFGLLSQKFAVLFSVQNPFERLKAMGRIYVEFAMNNPEMYELMFILKAPMECLDKDEHDWEEGMHAFDIVVKTAQECVDQKIIRPIDATTLSFTLWSALHGMCALNPSNRLEKMFEDKNTIITNSVDLVINNVLDSLKL